MGIDPGAHGAIACLEGAQLVVRDMPTISEGAKSRERCDPSAMAALMRAFQPDHVFVELVHSMPGNGGTAMFTFGTAYGYARGIPAALGFPVTLVSPMAWKQALRVPADKDAARSRASQLMPKHAGLWPLKKHDGRAEAALIALYGSQRGLAKQAIEW